MQLHYRIRDPKIFRQNLDYKITTLKARCITESGAPGEQVNQKMRALLPGGMQQRTISKSWSTSQNLLHQCETSMSCFFFGASQNIMTLVLFKCLQIVFICFYWPGQHATFGACETQPVGHSANYANHEKLCELLRSYEAMFYSKPLQNQLSMLYSRSIDYRINCPCSTQGQPPHPQTCIKSRIPPSTVRHLGPPYQHIESLQNQQPQERMLPLQNHPPHPHKKGHLEMNFFVYNIEALFVTQAG